MTKKPDLAARERWRLNSATLFLSINIYPLASDLLHYSQKSDQETHHPIIIANLAISVLLILESVALLW